jgi:primary-amine oxidase
LASLDAQARFQAVRQDIVLWYTIGFHHAPVPEDWPVLPAMWHEFSLRPRGFFSHSPVIDLPPLPVPAK